MNWEEFIDVISTLVKDSDIRQQIYDRMLDTCSFTDEEIREVLNVDKAFDIVAKDYIEDDLYEDEEGYDYDEE